MKQAGVRVARALRAWGPLNRLVTSATRAACRAAGVQSETMIRHLPRTGLVDATLPNGARLRMWSKADDWVPNQIYWRGWDGFEPEAVRVFFRLAARARVTLDVGAHIGLYGLLAAHANQDGLVFAFEPFKRTFDRLRLNIGLNHLPNLIPIRAAVGDRDQDACEFFHADVDGLPSSCSLSADFMNGRDGHQVNSVMVPMVMLDGFAQTQRLERVDLVKIDVEAAEPLVLAGMPRILKRDRPHILLEILQQTGTGPLLEQIFLGLGYRYYQLTPGGPVRRNSLAANSHGDNWLITTLAESEL